MSIKKKAEVLTAAIHFLVDKFKNPVHNTQASHDENNSSQIISMAKIGSSCFAEITDESIERFMSLLSEYLAEFAKKDMFCILSTNAYTETPLIDFCYEAKLPFYALPRPMVLEVDFKNCMVKAQFDDEVEQIIYPAPLTPAA